MTLYAVGNIFQIKARATQSTSIYLIQKDVGLVTLVC